MPTRCSDCAALVVRLEMRIFRELPRSRDLAALIQDELTADFTGWIRNGVNVCVDQPFIGCCRKRCDIANGTADKLLTFRRALFHIRVGPRSLSEQTAHVRSFGVER